MIGKALIVGGGVGGMSAALSLARRGVEVHLVVSPLGQRLLHDELGMEGIDLAALSGGAGGAGGAGGEDPRITLHHYRDVGAPIASGSFHHDGMIVCPCSNNSLAAIAHGLSENLLHRAANVTLKERRPLILAHREMPLGLIEIRNMEQIALAGGILAPTNPGFYMLPRGIEDLVDFVVGKLLDLVKVEHDLKTRWVDSAANWKAKRHESS